MINPFKKPYTPEELNIFRFLARIKIFASLSQKEMSYFLPYLYLRKYGSNEAVFFRGDPSAALYLVKNGKATLSLDVRDKFEFLRIVRPGESFGENALVPGAKRIYNAIVRSEQAEFYVIPKVNILEIFDAHEQVKAKMMSSLAEIYNQMMASLFKAYQSSDGFFSLTQAFLNDAAPGEIEFAF